MRHPFRLAAVALLVAGTSVLGLGAASAKAATIGPVTISPSAGSVEDTLAMTTSRGCPASADSSKSRIVGPGFSKFGQNLSGVAPGNTSRTKAFEVDSAYTLRDTASLAYPPVTYKGTYRVEVICVSSAKGEVGTFSTTITFVDAVHWKVSNPTAPVKVGPTASAPPISQSPVATPSPAPSTSASATTGVHPSASSSGSSTAAASAAASTPSAGTSDGEAVAAAADSTTTPSWLPLVGGVLLGGAVVGGGMVALQRRQNGAGAGGSH